MKCVKFGKISVSTTGATIDLSSYNFASAEDYFILYDSLTYSSAYVDITITAKTATSITLTKAAGNPCDIPYQIIALR